MMRMGADGELRIPLDIQPVSQPIDNIQTVSISVDQCECGTTQFL